MNKINRTLFNLFPATKEANFRLFLYGQLISFAGTWLQAATQGWLVKDMTESAKQVGIVASLSLFPAFLLAFFGGTMVDRFDKRKVLYATQIVAMIQAFVLGYLTITHQITLWEIKLLAFSLGVVNALDGPARHALMMQTTTTEEQLRSAVAMNASLIMLGQIAGGLLASILIPLVGVGGSFIINGLTFIAVIVTMLLMRLEKHPEMKHEHAIRAMISGWEYIRSQNGMLLQILLVGIIATLGFSYRAIFPIIAEKIFNGGPATLGFLQVAVATGAFVASIAVSKYSKQLAQHGLLFKYFVVGGWFMVVFFSLTHWLPCGLALLVVSGAGLIMVISTLRGTIQGATKKEIRGRVMGFIFTVFLGGMSLGSWLSGILAERFGSSQAVGVIGIASMALGVILFAKRNAIAIAPVQVTNAKIPIAKVVA